MCWKDGKTDSTVSATVFSEANNGIAFVTMKSETSKRGKGKSKKVTYYKCKQDRHYSNECNEEDMFKTRNKRGLSF